MVLTLLLFRIHWALWLRPDAGRVRDLRFLVGLWHGRGMFGAATTLVAESVPGNFRSMALVCSNPSRRAATMNRFAAQDTQPFRPGQTNFLFGYSGWRIIFFVGVLPALLVIPIPYFLREPRRGRKSRKDPKGQGWAEAHRLDFRICSVIPRWPQEPAGRSRPGPGGHGRTLGIGFFSPELISHGTEGRVPDRHRHGCARLRTALQDGRILRGMMTFTPGGHVYRPAAGLCRLVHPLPDHDHLRVQQSEIRH